MKIFDDGNKSNPTPPPKKPQKHKTPHKKTPKAKKPPNPAH